MYPKLYLFIIVILALGLPIFIPFNKLEGYSNYTLDMEMGKFPESVTNVLVQDTYPSIGKNQVSDETSNKMWWRYPTFQVGSYSQITNNIRYPYNPDDARCTAGDMCYATYKNKGLHTNYIKPLPPVNSTCGGTRVGYFTT
jgi:hypothetical protein